MDRLQKLKKRFQPGRPYRRAEVEDWSSRIDHDLKTLLDEGFLKKLRAGIYYRPRKSPFGEVPPDDRSLVQAFLKDDRFLMTSPNAYNALGLGTQLYNTQTVYNHKRHGDFTLGGRRFSFRVKHHFPKGKATPEFLLVDLVNNVNDLAEDREALLRRVQEKVRTMDQKRLRTAVAEYGSVATKHFFESVLHDTAHAT